MKNTLRKVIHVDMDAFYASVEQRDFPQYRGKPLVVGSPPDKRGVVAAASYEARRYGIHSAMSSYKASKLCPDVIFVSGRFEVYREVSHQIREVFAEYTDLIEPLSLDEAYLDVTENKPGIASATQIAQEIRRKIWEKTRLTASAGVSYNKFLAKTASDINKPNGQCVITPDKAAEFIDRLPIGKFYGIGKVTASYFAGMGVQTGSDLRALSLETLTRHFGKTGLYYYQIARGIDHRPVETEWVRKSVGAENTFEQDITDLGTLHRAFLPLIEDVWGWMRRHETYGRTLTIKVKYHDFQQVTRSKTLEQPITEQGNMLALAYSLLEKTEAGERPIRLLGVSVSNFAAPGEEEPPIRQLKLNLG